MGIYKLPVDPTLGQQRATRESHMRSVHGAAIAALFVFIALFPIVVSGCSGGGGGGGGGPTEVTLTITNCDATTFAAFGVICVDFTLTGPAGVYDVNPDLIGGTAGPLEAALEIPPALAQQLGVTSNAQNFVLAFNGDTVSGRFCWYAGADLGFVPAAGVQLYLTPVNDGTLTAAGPFASCIGMNYAGGGQTQTGAGPNIGALNGRAAHCGENVSGKNIAIAGGYTGSATYSTADRFTV